MPFSRYHVVIFTRVGKAEALRAALDEFSFSRSRILEAELEP